MSILLNEILIGLAVANAAFNLLSGRSKSRRRMIAWEASAAGVSLLYFFLIGRYLPMAGSFFYISVALLAYLKEKNSMWQIWMPLPGVFALGIAIYGYKDPLDLLVVAAAIVDFIGKWRKTTLALRLSLGSCNILWFTYLWQLGRPIEASLNIIFFINFIAPIIWSHKKET